MSRRKRSRSDAPSLAELRRTLNRARTGGLDFATLQKALGVLRDSGLTRPIASDIVSEWRTAFEETQARFPNVENQIAADNLRLSFEISGVFRDGMICGECRHGGETFRLFANHPAGGIPAGCNCATSNGELPCSHTYHFIQFVIRLLSNRSSYLSTRLLEGDFQSSKPDLNRFKHDALATFRRLLQRLPTEVAELEEQVDLPESSQKSMRRIAWNVSMPGESVRIEPVVQQAKKRGDGWTKGRKVPLEQLGEYIDLLQEHDWRVRNLIYLDSQYYSRSFMLDALPALYRLIDSPNVLLDGSPVAVRGFDLILAYQRNDRECWLELNHPCAAGAEMYGWSEYFTFLSVSTGEIYIQKLAPHQNELLSAILQTPPIPLALEDEFLKRIEAYRQTLNIVMPTETGGEIVQEPDHPVIVLRVDSAGTLDYGLRLRDGLGILHRPGQGRILRPAERDGRRIQYKRDVEQATQRLRQLVRELGLTTSDQDGSVDDFEKSLDLLGQLQQLESSGVEILWDKQSAKQMRVLGTVSANNVSVGISRKRDWFQLTGSCAVGSDSIELVELLGALEAARSETLVGDYIRIGDRGWTRIESGLRQQLRQLGDSLTQERKNLRFDASSTLALRGFLQGNLDVQIDAVQSWHQCLARLERAENLEPELPANLQAELREYQLDGFRWLRRLSEWGVGGILADDMGLGKTLQTLAVILDRSADGPTLVVAPTSVGFNWVQEAEKFAPDLDVHLYRETDRADFLSKVGPGSLVVCSYGLALRDETQLAAVDWSTLVLDEAQAIKNSRSKTSVAIAKIPARWRVALTGTPVENHLGELWSLFHVVSPGVFGGWDQFRRRFAAPIEKEDCDERKAALRERLKPFVLRRTKGQVLNDLPPRTDMNIYVELSADERAMYDRVRASAIGEIDQIAKLDNVKDQRFRILALLTRLRQMACSPRIVHSQWEHRSSKLIELVNVLHELKEEGHRVLIFSQFVKHLELIREALNAEQISLEYLDGSTPAAQRQKCVDSFQQGTATAFLISLKAGGTGLNLTAADYVIHMDPWWNPAVEDQATDRAHRIGQDKPVMVYRIIARGTIEEEILKLHETKRDLVAGIMDGTHAAAKLSTEDLINLVKGR